MEIYVSVCVIDSGFLRINKSLFRSRDPNRAGAVIQALRGAEVCLSALPAAREGVRQHAPHTAASLRLLLPSFLEGELWRAHTPRVLEIFPWGASCLLPRYLSSWRMLAPSSLPKNTTRSQNGREIKSCVGDHWNLSTWLSG